MIRMSGPPPGTVMIFLVIIIHISFAFLLGKHHLIHYPKKFHF